jgi:PKD repeat protein
MMTRTRKAIGRGWIAAAAGVSLFVALQACNVTKVAIPGLSGPSGLGTSLKLSANPSVLLADNRSQSVVTIIARDQNGNLAPGIPLKYAIIEGSSIVQVGQLNLIGGSTDGNGTATVVYTAPARTDIDGDITVLIGARVDDGDATGSFYRTVGIEIFPPEPPLFPQNPGAKPPNCNFAIEPAAGGSFHPGQQVLFQDASSANAPAKVIVRYQWDFGDGTNSATLEQPDVNHAYNTSGSFSVTHVVTDNLGQSATCAQSITVF